MDEQATFHEEQRMSGWFAWALGTAIALAGLRAVGRAVRPRPDHPVGKTAPRRRLGRVLRLAAALGLLGFMKLETEVRADGVYYRFSPFHRHFHRIAFDDIDAWEVRDYHPLRHYGGWGIRYGLGARGMAYTAWGSRGVWFRLKNGKRRLIGSQRADEMGEAITNAMAKGRA